MKKLEAKVIEWAIQQDIFASSNNESQCRNILTEACDLLDASKSGDQIEDAIGDMLMSLILQADMNDTTAGNCLAYAYRRNLWPQGRDGL